MSKLFSSCAAKFRDYLAAKRIVLLDQQGDICHHGDWWWARVFEKVPPPASISEMWSEAYDWLDDEQQGWMFDKIFPLNSQLTTKM